MSSKQLTSRSGLGRRSDRAGATTALGRSRAVMSGVLVSLASCANVWGFRDLAGPDDGAANAGDGSASGSEGGSGSSGSGGGSSGSGSGSGGEADGATCSGACVAPAPPGWNGPVEMAAGPVVPPCGADWLGPREQLNAGLNAPSAICTCSCSAPSGFSCSVQATCGTNSCASCGPAQTIPPNQCVMPATYSVLLSSPTASGGMCTASGPTASLPPIGWSMQIQSCAPSTAPSACAGGDVCAPILDPSFATCVRQDGDIPCPTGSYSARTLGYEGAPVDTRGCGGTCSCGAPSGIACGGNWVNYGINTCSVGGTSYGLNTCVTTNGVSSEYIPSPSGGSCVGSGGEPTGSVAPTNPVTFCCLP
jgi:hypothetical protein